MRNIKDWCISRQLWWGHRIPAWYDSERPLVRCAQRSGGARRARARFHGGPAPGRGRAGYLVLLGALALLDSGLAAADARAAHLLPHLRSGHGFRHHIFLGRPHDHDGPEIHGRGAVSRSLRARPDPRSRRPEDVQIQGQRDRPAGHRRRHLARRADRQAHQRSDAAADEAGHREGDAQAVSAGHPRLRHRCAAAHLRVARDAEPRPALRHGQGRGQPQFLQQALERRALRADERRRRGSAPRGRRA